MKQVIAIAEFYPARVELTVLGGDVIYEAE